MTVSRMRLRPRPTMLPTAFKASKGGIGSKAANGKVKFARGPILPQETSSSSKSSINVVVKKRRHSSQETSSSPEDTDSLAPREHAVRAEDIKEEDIQEEEDIKPPD